MKTKTLSAATLLFAATLVAPLQATSVTSGLRVWLNAESGTSSNVDGVGLTSWTDAQNGHVFGNANILLPTYVADAGGGLPAIDFRRSSGFLGDFSGSGDSTLGDATVFVVGKFDGYTHSAESSSYWFSIDSSTNQSEHTLGRDASGPSSDALYHWRAQPGPAGYYGTNTVETDDDFNYFTAVYRGGGESGVGMRAWINGSSSLTGVADVSTAGSDTAYGADPSKTRIGLWTNSGSGLDGQIRELLVYDRILSPTEVDSVEQYLSGRLAGDPEPPRQPTQEFLFQVDLSGQPNGIVPGFVPHGDPAVSGSASFAIRDDNTMDYRIELSDNRYRVTQAHFYNINTTSGTSDNAAHGDSILCWGGRWESNAPGGDSSDFLVGHGYSNSRLIEVLASPTDWALILHTEGGHFALEDGGLVEYDPDLNGPQETSVTGVPQSERARRFNNRVGKTLLDMVLREDNTSDRAAPFHDPTSPDNQNASPFPDAAGNLWVEPDGTGGFQLTAEAIARGYDLNTEYLFYLYDDQGPAWDFGGPEGAMIGFLQPIPEPSSFGIFACASLAFGMKTWRSAVVI